MIIQNWLDQLCLMIPNVQVAIVVDHLDARSHQQAMACWPNKTINTDVLFKQLPLLKAQGSPVVSIAKQSPAESNKTIIEKLVIAYPLSLSNASAGAVLIEVVAKASQQSILLQMLKWGHSWLQLLLQHVDENEQNTGALQAKAPPPEHPSFIYFSIVQAVLACADHQQALMTLVNKIVTCWPFERVALGVVNGQDIEVKAISHSAHFDGRSNLIVNMSQAMAEVKDTPGGIYFSASECDELASYVGHQRLLVDSDISALISLPLQDNDQTVAVLLCEFKDKTHDNQQLASQYLAKLNILAGLLGPLIALHQRGNQSVSAHFAGRSRARLTGLQQGKFGRLPLIAGFILLLGLTGFINTDFRVATEATIEGRIQRAVVAPFDGYIDMAFARAGELIQQGEAIAQLDDQPLQLEKQGWLSKKEEYQNQYRQELVSLNHAQAQIIKAQIAQAEIQIAQVDSRLQRAKLVSPLSGVIIEGDLSRSLGAPVERGQVLFEVAPLDEYRVVLKVHEQDIAYLQKGQTGSLMLKAYPKQSIPLIVEQVAIVYEQEGDYTWYRTEASIDQDNLPSDMLLRPGMEGLGKIEVGEKSLAWLGFHRLVDWFRLWFWSWTP
ncbi:efflux RND transporter periplasmic adaptor subunit [Psychromonas sp. KJ10-10]|uniref:efflux RND transporter periplasmic adaptor subunit n=1 Tax=Psychromonas sp. KJ10-10 TaxID=3391823 RepID=UPI0039B3E443